LSVLVVGSINMDMTLYLPRWPAVGETIRAHETLVQLGGKGANQAIAAARLGGRVTMIGALGRDGFGSRASAELIAQGVALYADSLDDTPTGIASIDVGPDGQNIIRLSPGANDAVIAQTVTRKADVFAGVSVLLLQNEIPLDGSCAAAHLARAAGALVIMDPAPAPDTPWGPDVLSQFDIVTPNLAEARLLSGLSDDIPPAQVAAKLAQHCGRGAIVTMGGDGVVWCIDGQSGAAPACKVDAIDTVAAGDCFNGALATALAQGAPVADAVTYALHAAALATTRRGAAASLPAHSEVTTFISSRASGAKRC